MAGGPSPSALSDSVLESIKVIFFQECDELVAELESCLLSIESGEADAETINAAFRAAHSIKGSAGTFGFDILVRFSHVFENALDRVRGDTAPAGVDVIRMLLRATDVLADLVRAARDQAPVDEERHLTLMDELAAFAGGETPAPPEEEDDDDLMGIEFTPVQVELAAPPAAEPGLQVWRIEFRPRPSLYERANEPLLLLRDLQRLGEVSIVLHDEDLPMLPDLDPEGAYIGWTIELSTGEAEERIREVFEFVDDDCDLTIARVGGESAAPVEDRPAPTLPAAAEEAPAAGEAPARAAPAASKPSATAAPAPSQATIRVDLDRVDRLIDLVGELIINQAVIGQRMHESGLSRTSAPRAALEDLEQLTRELQRNVMAIRAQPVKSVFQRMSRLVREVEEATGKEVVLLTEGEGTEVDKTVIERLTDPITHMIRNAIDHGIEAPAARAAAGKPPKGVVRLSARHRSGQIVIEVADDGGGVNRARVREIAIARGLIEPDADLADHDIDNLIFAPGFSTAATVSDLSGRGVGLDVVRRSVQALGGRISMTSRPGEGATMALSLPLTLAVMDGMVVTVAGQTLVTPLTAVVQTLQPTADAIRRLGADLTLLRVGDSHVPLIDVGVLLGYRREALDPAAGVIVLCDGGDLGRGALLVDDIQDQRQVVIKSLEANYQVVDGVSAATILGDGRVALILDVDAILARSGRLNRSLAARGEQEALCA